jgi:hypothetical protein
MHDPHLDSARSSAAGGSQTASQDDGKPKESNLGGLTIEHHGGENAGLWEKGDRLHWLGSLASVRLCGICYHNQRANPAGRLVTGPVFSEIDAARTETRLLNHANANA